MAGERIDDLATLTTEAASNAIRYAYEEGEAGELRVELLGPERDELRLVVRDWGGGIRPRLDRELPSMRMGLPIIGALSRGFTLDSVLGGGTRLEVRVPMW